MDFDWNLRQLGNLSKFCSSSIESPKLSGWASTNPPFLHQGVQNWEPCFHVFGVLDKIFCTFAQICCVFELQNIFQFLPSVFAKKTWKCDNMCKTSKVCIWGYYKLVWNLGLIFCCCKKITFAEGSFNCKFKYFFAFEYFWKWYWRWCC